MEQHSARNLQHKTLQTTIDMFTAPSHTLHKSLCISVMFFVVIQSVSSVQLFAIPWTEAHQASLSFTVSQSLLKFMSHSGPSTEKSPSAVFEFLDSWLKY